MCLGTVSRYGTSNDLPSFLTGSSAREGGARHSTASAAHDNHLVMSGLPGTRGRRNPHPIIPNDGERGASAPWCVTRSGALYHTRGLTPPVRLGIRRALAEPARAAVLPELDAARRVR